MRVVFAALLAVVSWAAPQPHNGPFVVNLRPQHTQTCAAYSVCEDMRIIPSDSTGSALSTQCANWYEPGKYHGIGNRNIDFEEYIVGIPGHRYELWGRWENHTSQPQTIGEFYSLICHTI
ncbi:MAG: hypothetical protein KGL39_32935 [Patescibacteria group bacterium]|nr:hypothetical protein [Patescibacteria group bacterium]